MSVNMLFSVMSLISAPVTIFTVLCSPGPPQSRIDKVVTKVVIKVKGYETRSFSSFQNEHCAVQLKLNNDLVIGERSLWLHKNISAGLSSVYHYTQNSLEDNFLSTSAKCIGKIKYNKIPRITL